MNEEYQALLASQDFKDFTEHYPQHFLANAFILQNSQYAPNWQFGFFDEETDKISAFTVKKEDDTYVIEVQQADDATKEPTAILLPLDIDTVALTFEQAYSLAVECAEKEYGSSPAQSKIFLLQNTVEHGLIWNITIISTSFDVINVKIDAKLGDVKAHSKHSLLDMSANRV